MIIIKTSNFVLLSSTITIRAVISVVELTGIHKTSITSAVDLFEVLDSAVLVVQ